MVCGGYVIVVVFFFKQKTAYEMRISDWSSDVCSSDLAAAGATAAFLVNAIFFLPMIVALLLWRRVQEPSRLPPEKLMRAIISGGRYVLHSPSIRPIKIGRASCRERVCQYVYISVVAVSLKKQQMSQRSG